MITKAASVVSKGIADFQIKPILFQQESRNHERTIARPKVSIHNSNTALKKF